MREVVWILYVDGISMCLCIDLRGYVRILGAPSAPSGFLSDVCFLLISLWQMLQIQTCVRVCFGPGFVSTSPAFNSISASQPSGPLGRPAQKTVETGPHCGEQEG